jgi:hypothetical protein
MWVLLGVSDDTVENETFVYFIGVFDDLQLAKLKRDKLILSTNSKKSDYIIKPIAINTSYNYDWSNDEENDIGS